jgi:thymidylate kinase
MNRCTGGVAVLRTEITAWAAQYDVIVLEGCDGTGKTTLATALATRHNYALVHSGRTPDGTDIIGRYRAILARPGPLVLDRSFISELVYGPLLHGRCRLSFADVASLVSIVTSRGGMLAHLTGEPAQIADRLLARDGHAPDTPLIHALTATYGELFARLAEHARVITIDTTATRA